MTDPTPADAPRKDAPDDRASSGPFDESEANPVRPYIDLGGIKILPREGLNLRLEVEEQTKRIVAVGLDYADSTLQVQPFAAPRSAGLWAETREQIRAQMDQTESEYDKEKFSERLARLTGGVAIIQVGGVTEAEMKQTRGRVEDALHATRAAIAEGIVPGGGTNCPRSGR